MRTWALTALISGSCFGALMLVLHLVPEIHALDAAVIRAIAPLQTFDVVSFFLAVTVLGGGVGIITVAVGFAYFMRLSSREVLRLAFLLAVVLFLNRLFKDVIARTRPDALQWFDTLPSYSFPSAHATAVMALYGFMLVYLYQKGYRLTLLIPGAVILLVGISRIMLNAHHVSDVIGGYLLGLALLSLSFLLPFARLSKVYGRA